MLRRLSKPALFLVCLAPGLLLAWDAYAGQLSANPVEDLTHRTGWWGLFLLTATLAITPVRRVTGWNGIIKFRRMVGLFAFCYVTLHFLVYLVLDQFFAWSFIVEDVIDRPYITVGFTAFVLLLALAVTSTNGWIRRLGKRWRYLHSLIYVAALAGVIHFLWLVKADLREPTIFGLVLTVLLSARLWRSRRRARPAAPQRPPAQAAPPDLASGAVRAGSS
jgi:sulfoxide reductase heme-binding subunit YedZ